MRDDPEFNIKFCELVELIPCLYDKTCLDYSKERQQEAWVKIGEHLKENALDCKNRWNAIKKGYVTNRKRKSELSESDAKQIKDYYLTAHLQFLDPFLVFHKTKNKTITSTTREDTDDEMYANNEHSDESAAEQFIEDKFVNKQNCVEETDTWESDDPDMAFMQSLLPDMKSMDARTKIKFKVEVLRIADQLLDH